MALATATADGRPSARMVLLKGVDARGFVVLHQLREPQGRGAGRHAPRGAAVLLADARTSGPHRGTRWRACRTPSRTPTSRRGRSRAGGARYASPQSRPIDSREALEAARRPQSAPQLRRRGAAAAVRGAATACRPTRSSSGRAGENRLHDRLALRALDARRAGAASGSRRRRQASGLAGFGLSVPPRRSVNVARLGGVVPSIPISRHSVRGRCMNERSPLPVRAVAIGGQPSRCRARVRAGVSPVTAADDRRRHARRRRRLRARDRARTRPATIGLSRFSLTQLAARIAAPRLAGRGIAPASALALEAVAARAAFETARRGELSRFSRRWPARPAFRARSRDRSATCGSPGCRAPTSPAPATARACAICRRLVTEAERELDEARVADRARLFEAARDARAGASAFLAHPLVLLDLEIGSPVEEAFVLALAAAASRGAGHRACRRIATARAVWSAAGAVIETRAPAGTRRSRRHPDAPVRRGRAAAARRATARSSSSRRPARAANAWRSPAGSCARRAAACGFDEMAVLVRAPAHYLGLLEHALERAGVPACFERGTRRPHAGRPGVPGPAGVRRRRAVGQPVRRVPVARPAAGRRCASRPRGCRPATSCSPRSRRATRRPRRTMPSPSRRSSRPPTTQPAIAGTLRAPRRWEWMLVEAAVIGGDPERWRRRLRRVWPRSCACGSRRRSRPIPTRR